MNTISRGIQNNNPANIQANDSIHWDGQIHQPFLTTERRFAVFESPAAGIRAAILNFQSYVRHDGAKTWADLIDRHAPPSENDDGKYKSAVGSETGFDLNAPAAVHDRDALRKFVSAVIVVECGNYVYDDAIWTMAENSVWPLTEAHPTV